VGAAHGLEPIDLEIPRRTPVMAISFYALAAAALGIGGLVSSDGLRVRLLSLAVLSTVFAVVAVISWIVIGDEGRWLRLDDEGMTLAGRGIPWEAVMTARWAYDAIGTRPRRPGIELRLRRVDGYQPPRSASVSINSTLFGISGNELLDLIVRYARPHTVYVLAPRHPPDVGIF